METQTLRLGEYWDRFIEEQLEDGKYSSNSEVIRDALRLLEDEKEKQKMEDLRQALIEGEESGDAGELDMDKILKSAQEEIKRRQKSDK